jgi:UDP-N-acetylmuramate dehydrogenase
MAVNDATAISCGAGEDLTTLVEFAAKNGLSGLEFAAGIWGTVGGAIYGNAGAYGGEVGARVESLTLVEPSGDVKDVDRDYCRFGYRDSYLKSSGDIVVEARFRLETGDVEEIRRKVDEIVAIREVKFPPDGKSAGCFFKNIPDPKEKFGKLPAGRLLEQVGAKGMSVGGARVFDKHANIIVNTGSATSKDIRLLADKLKEKVFAEFGIRLEEEIIQVGDI